MKKVFVIMLCFLLLSGCSGVSDDKPPVPDLNFSGDIIVTYKKCTFECEIVNNPAVNCVITVRKPQLISGLTMTVEDGKCTFEMGDVSYEMNPEQMAQTDFATSLAGALKDVLNTTTCEKLDNGYWKYTGNTEKSKFILLQDSESGYPLSLRMPDIDLTVKFENMKSE